jgi:hypothetical protein
MGGSVDLRSIVAESAAQVRPWAVERGRDLARVPVNFARDLPGRLSRLGDTLTQGVTALADAGPEAAWLVNAGDARRRRAWLQAGARETGFWFLGLATRLFDLVSGPEVGQVLIHLTTSATPLQEDEIEAAKLVLGPHAIRWGEVRIAQRGVLGPVFRRNGVRAFTTFHTINMPLEGRSLRSDLAVVVHELTHVLQYERQGSIYIIQALRAQARGDAYNYGGAEGLRDRFERLHQHLTDLNPEQQAAVAQDYYAKCLAGPPGPQLKELFDSYGPWIAELRAKNV